MQRQEASRRPAPSKKKVVGKKKVVFADNPEVQEIRPTEEGEEAMEEDASPAVAAFRRAPAAAASALTRENRLKYAVDFLRHQWTVVGERAPQSARQIAEGSGVVVDSSLAADLDQNPRCRRGPGGSGWWTYAPALELRDSNEMVALLRRRYERGGGGGEPVAVSAADLREAYAGAGADLEDLLRRGELRAYPDWSKSRDGMSVLWAAPDLGMRVSDAVADLFASVALPEDLVAETRRLGLRSAMQLRDAARDVEWRRRGERAQRERAEKKKQRRLSAAPSSVTNLHLVDELFPEMTPVQKAKVRQKAATKLLGRGGGGK